MKWCEVVEDAGGYESEYDPWYEGLATGHWTQKDYSQIHISKMSKSHMRNCIRLCENAKLRETFECEMDKWQDWIDLFVSELASRPTSPGKPEHPRNKQRGQTRRMKCHCGTEYDARIADLNRGWARSCSKRCAAIRREFGRPAATAVNVEVCL